MNGSFVSRGLFGVCLEFARAAGSVFSIRPWALCCVSSVSMRAVVRSGRPFVEFRLRVYFGRQATAQVVIPFDCVSVICAFWVSLTFVIVNSAVVCVLPPVLVRALQLCVGDSTCCIPW